MKEGKIASCEEDRVIHLGVYPFFVTGIRLLYLT